MKQIRKRAEQAPTLLYYAPGGGLGHLTRAIAILRQWKKHTKRPSLLVTYSRFAALAEREGLAVKQIPGPEAQHLKGVLSWARPKLLVADTFPRGILGEIADLVPSLDCPAVLVQRYLNPAYLRQFNVAAFVAQHYRLVVRIADSLPPQTLSQRTVDVPPVTVREARELPAPGVRSGWLLVDWGEDSAPYVDVAAEVARRCGKQLHMVRPGEYYPAVELMGKAELVIGGGGYNFYHETALTGTPAVFVPGRRMYDDQFGRTVAAAQARTPEALVALLEADPPPALPPHPGEGAAAAVAVMQALLAGMEKATADSEGATRRGGTEPKAAARKSRAARRGKTHR